MVKETIVKDDGRLLTFYSFADEKEEGKSDKSARPCCCKESEKTKSDDAKG